MTLSYHVVIGPGNEIVIMLQVEQVTFLGLGRTTGIATRSASKVGIFGDDWNEKQNCTCTVLWNYSTSLL